MEVYRRSSWRMLILLNFLLFSTTLQGVQGEVELDGPSESECRPHIEKALKQFETGENEHALHTDNGDSREDLPTVEITTDEHFMLDDHEEEEPDAQSSEIEQIDENEIDDNDDSDDSDENDNDNNSDNDDNDDILNTSNTEDTNTSNESEEQNISTEDVQTQYEETTNEIQFENEENVDDTLLEQEQNDEPFNTDNISEEETPEDNIENDNENVASDENKDEQSDDTSKEQSDEVEFTVASNENVKEDEDVEETNLNISEDLEEEHHEDQLEEYNQDQLEQEPEQIQENEEEINNEEAEIKENAEVTEDVIIPEDVILLQKVVEPLSKNTEKEDEEIQTETSKEVPEIIATEENGQDTEEDLETEEPVVEELLKNNEEDYEKLRPRDHIAQLLKLDTISQDVDNMSEKTSEIVLKELKKLYDNAIKPLETLYKYRDLSNRHFGDSEIFSKPLILFMGPWSGGKSTIINYLLGIEHSELNLHTGAEPSPAYFNILMYGQEPEILDGTELSADYTFSGLQKFGQGLEERLRGYKFPSKLLEKVNIVEIPGILEVRKQVSRIFPFNDACQWFIDRADVIFLVYDPSKLDVGPETEAILDQLKGREHQTRIVLNKADQVKPEELMRVQGALIWNISPLMSSAQPPIMYTTSLWSQPYEQWAPVRLLQAQERAFLRDLRSAIDKKIDNKIASARRFAVRVRNHAKMVDCYLTTYYNHKSVFGNRKQVSDEIINHPQDYHIYEGLSTLTNISRYDLPDPDVYRDFFRLNALYDFQKLSSTCTYFRGCPINRLDVAIAYDLPELVGKHKRLIEAAFSEAATTKTPPGS